jgi:hypothetical protein
VVEDISPFGRKKEGRTADEILTAHGPGMVCALRHFATLRGHPDQLECSGTMWKNGRKSFILDV